MKCATFLLFFVVLSSAYKVDVIDAESWRYEYIKYNLTGDQPQDNSYEVRRYAAAEWVSTLVQESTEEKAMKVAFKRLVEYAQGANDKGMDLYMTVPIVMEFHATQCIFCWSRFTMSFCLPSRYQDKPPKPTNKDVFLKKEAARIVYVRPFSGYTSPRSSKVAAHRLYCDLQRHNVNVSNVESNHMYVSVYGTPLGELQEANEIWLRLNNGTRTNIFAFDKIRNDGQEDQGFVLG